MDRIFHHDDTMYEAATKVYVKSDGRKVFNPGSASSEKTGI